MEDDSNIDMNAYSPTSPGSDVQGRSRTFSPSSPDSVVPTAEDYVNDAEQILRSHYRVLVGLEQGLQSGKYYRIDEDLRGVQQKTDEFVVWQTAFADQMNTVVQLLKARDQELANLRAQQAARPQTSAQQSTQTDAVTPEEPVSSQFLPAATVDELSARINRAVENVLRPLKAPSQALNLLAAPPARPLNTISTPRQASSSNSILTGQRPLKRALEASVMDLGQNEVKMRRDEPPPRSPSPLPSSSLQSHSARPVSLASTVSSHSSHQPMLPSNQQPAKVEYRSVAEYTRSHQKNKSHGKEKKNDST